MGNKILKGAVSKKCETSSIDLRKQGNSFMSAKKFESSLRCYTQSIACAQPGSNALAYAYANRAAVLKSLDHEVDAIEDCERALQCGYPDHLKYKVLRRLGQCYFKLNLHQLAKVNFEAALASLEEASPRSVTDKAAINKELAACKNSNGTKPKNIPQPDIPRIRYGNNVKELPNASNGVTLKYTKELGRHLVATENFVPGEVILVEDPIAAVLSSNKLTDHCTHCLKACRNPIPCHRCIWALFCSDSCLENAKSYHTQECEIVSSDRADADDIKTQLTIRMLCIYGFKKMEEFLMTHEEKQEVTEEERRTRGCNSSGQYDPTDPIVTYCLQEKKTDPKDVWDFEQNASRLAQLIVPAKSPLQQKLLKFMVKFQKSLKINKVVVLQYFDPENRLFTQVGEGVYGTYSLINHSCCPNVMVGFYGKTLVVRAIRSIPKGTQICMSYGPHFLSGNKIDRQRFLKDYGNFKCKCEACVNNWPLEDDLPPGTWLDLTVEGRPIDPIFSSLCVMLELAQHTSNNGWKVTHDTFSLFLRHIAIVDKYKRSHCGAYHRIVCDVRLFLYEKAYAFYSHLLT